MLDQLKDLLRARNQRRKAMRTAMRQPRMTPHGFRFIGPALMQSGAFEGDLAALIARLIGHADRFVNVGANAGYYCAMAQSRGIPTIALEPNPVNFDLLQRNMDANGWGEAITALPIAASATSGFVTLFGEGTGSSVVPGWAGNPNSGARIVPKARLDTILHPPAPDENLFILMDVEGHEHAALEGAADLIRAPQKPIWMVEVSLLVHQPDGTTVNPNYVGTLNMFRENGYEVLSTEHGLADPGWDATIARADSAPDRGDNFIFCSKDAKELILGEA